MLSHKFCTVGMQGCVKNQQAHAILCNLGRSQVRCNAGWWLQLLQEGGSGLRRLNYRLRQPTKIPGTCSAAFAVHAAPQHCCTTGAKIFNGSKPFLCLGFHPWTSTQCSCEALHHPCHILDILDKVLYAQVYVNRYTLDVQCGALVLHQFIKT